MRYNLSEINAVIKDRRTIYPETYSDRKVHKEQIELLLNNALWAPTHGMTQPWRFKVYMGDSKQKLAMQLLSCYNNYAGEKAVEAKQKRTVLRVEKSSAVIAICMQKDPNNKIPEIFSVRDLSLLSILFNTCVLIICLHFCKMQDDHQHTKTESIHNHYHENPIDYRCMQTLL